MAKDIYLSSDYPDVMLPACPIEKKLKGQTVIVTGASSGIGRGIALGLGHSGANVVIHYAQRKSRSLRILSKR